MEEYNQYGIIPLAERMENAYKSSNGLYPHEIIVLFYAVNVNIKMYKKWKIKMYNLGSTIHQLSYHQ